MARRRIPQVANGQLIFSDSGETARPSIAIGSPEWFSWISDKDTSSFAILSADGSITFRREQQRNGFYWYAYHWHDKKLHKYYIGKSEELTYERLTALTFIGPSEEKIQSASPALRLSLLGKPVVIRNSQAIVELSRKAFILLAYLAVHTEPQPRERLMTMLWPESQDDAARKNLRNMIWTIRNVLGEHVVQGNERLLLDKSVWVDVWAFKQAVELGEASLSEKTIQYLSYYEEALTLYHGELLDGVSIADSSDIQLWLSLERERLNQILLHVLLVLINAARLDGKWSTVLDLSHRALLADSLQETIYRMQMEAYARLGERGQAMRQYSTLHTILQHELGVDPLVETEVLRAAILRGDLEPSLSVHRSFSLQEQASSHVLSTPPQIPFIGRQHELTRLHAEFQAAAQGQFRTVLITGEVGIGKSRLWREWSTLLTFASQHATFVHMRALEVTRTDPFAPLLTWFNQSPWRPRLFSPNSLLAPVWQAELLRLLPASQISRSDLPSLPLQAKTEERLRIFEAFSQCLLTIQQYDSAPIVFFLDDAHWIDTMTIQWLVYITERLRGIPLLLLLAFRPEEMSPTLNTHIANWKQQPETHHITLSRFNEDEARVLIAALGEDFSERRSLYEQSAGNPYFLLELLQAPAGTFPSSLTDLVRTRVTNLSEVVRQVLQAAAVLEPVIDFETLRWTCGRSEDETLDALDSLIQAALLVEQKQHYAFAHPLIAAIVRESLGSARHTVLHRRAAHAYTMTTTAERLPLVAGQLAIHYQEAGESEQAAHYAEIAAEHARIMTDWDEAVRLYRKALTLAPTPLRTLRLGQALLEQGNLTEAHTILQTALHEYQAQTDQRGATYTCLTIAILALKMERPDEVLSWTRRASNSYIENDAEAQAMIHFLLGYGLSIPGRPSEDVEEHLAEARRLTKASHLADLSVFNLSTASNE